MSDYISRELALADFEQCNRKNSTWTPQRVKTLLMRIPSADAVPVRHGAWYPRFEDWRQQQEGNKCSVCGFEYYGTGIRSFHYCPNCGAKMGLEGENGT
nr:MAG TPA: Endonuclease VIII [Caudoviricetes sp.]